MDRIRLNPDQYRQSRGATPSSSKARPTTISRGIQALFSAYRSADFADPEGFVAQLGTVLSEFSEEVVVYVTSPRTGLQRRSKWPPTLSEVLEACEEHQDYLRRVQTTKPVNLAQIAPPSTGSRAGGYWANVHVPELHARYARLAEWTKTVDEKFWRFGPNSNGEPGVWVPLNVWQDAEERRTPNKFDWDNIPPTVRNLSGTPELRAAMAQRLEPETVNE